MVARSVSLLLVLFSAALAGCHEPGPVDNDPVVVTDDPAGAYPVPLSRGTTFRVDLETGYATAPPRSGEPPHFSAEEGHDACLPDFGTDAWGRVSEGSTISTNTTAAPCRVLAPDEAVSVLIAAVPPEAADARFAAVVEPGDCDPMTGRDFQRIDLFRAILEGPDGEVRATTVHSTYRCSDGNVEHMWLTNLSAPVTFAVTMAASTPDDARYTGPVTAAFDDTDAAQADLYLYETDPTGRWSEDSQVEHV